MINEPVNSLGPPGRLLTVYLTLVLDTCIQAKLRVQYDLEDATRSNRFSLARYNVRHHALSGVFFTHVKCEETHK
jgi:hypothetical protein